MDAFLLVAPQIVLFLVSFVNVKNVQISYVTCVSYYHGPLAAASFNKSQKNVYLKAQTSCRCHTVAIEFLLTV